MRKNSDSIQDFLRETGMSAACIRTEEVLPVFLNAMRAGLAGAASSLAMRPAYLSVDSRPKSRSVIAVDAGGTNLRVSLITFDGNGAPAIEYLKKMPMPGTGERLTKDGFYLALAEAIAPVGGESSDIGFCFSFPAEILPSREGRLLRFCKEVRVDGAEGSLLGLELNRALASLGHAHKRVTVLNDTSAVLMSSLTGGSSFDGLIGYVLGTGSNAGYLEDTARIPKLNGFTGPMIVNTECGMYDGFPRGRIDRILDSGSEIPGDHLSEKMMSGAYLGTLIFLTAREACAEGFFSPAFAQRISAYRDLPLAEIGACLQTGADNPVSALLGSDEEDRLMFSQITEGILDRAAKLTAIQLAAIMEQTDTGKSPSLPCAVSAEGSTFHRAPFYGEKLEQYRKTWMEPVLHRYMKIISNPDAVIIGTAVAGAQA